MTMVIMRTMVVKVMIRGMMMVTMCNNGVEDNCEDLIGGNDDGDYVS